MTTQVQYPELGALRHVASVNRSCDQHSSASYNSKFGAHDMTKVTLMFSNKEHNCYVPVACKFHSEAVQTEDIYSAMPERLN